MSTINSRSLLFCSLVCALLPSCGGEQLANRPVQVTQQPGGSQDATGKVTGSPGQTAAGGGGTTSQPQAQPQPPAQGGTTTTPVTASKLGWDGTSFVGTKTLTLFPTE